MLGLYSPCLEEELGDWEETLEEFGPIFWTKYKVGWEDIMDIDGKGDKLSIGDEEKIGATVLDKWDISWSKDKSKWFGEGCIGTNKETICSKSNLYESRKLESELW